MQLFGLSERLAPYWSWLFHRQRIVDSLFAMAKYSAILEKLQDWPNRCPTYYNKNDTRSFPTNLVNSDCGRASSSLKNRQEVALLNEFLASAGACLPPGETGMEIAYYYKHKSFYRGGTTDERIDRRSAA
jgi:hypothetical protein